MLGLSYEKLARQILMRKTYAGFIVYKGEEFLGRHQPIISLETYERAMQRMAERAGKFRGDAQNLLTGLVRCGVCGAKMRYQRWGNQGFRLVCYSKDKSKPHLVKDPDCNNPGIWAAELENVVKEDLFSIGLKNSNAKIISEKSTADLIKENEKKLTEKLKRLYNLYAESQDEVLKSTIDEVKKNLDEVKKQIAREESQKVITKRNRELKKQLLTLRESWDYMTQKERRSVIESCISEIIVDGKSAEIYYNFG